MMPKVSYVNHFCATHSTSLYSTVPYFPSQSRDHMNTWPNKHRVQHSKVNEHLCIMQKGLAYINIWSKII